MKRLFICILFLTLLISGCAAPDSSPTTSTESTQIEPTNTSVPPAPPSTSVPPTMTSTPSIYGGFWTARADLPTGRWEHNPCVVDGKIYVIGGAGPTYQALGAAEVYDPASDTWMTVSEMPTARQGFSCSVVNGKIYAIGGGVSTSTSYGNVETFSAVEEYDPVTDTWTSKSPMPTSRGWHAACVVDEKIYVIGGSQDSAPSGRRVLAVVAYDPATDTWSQMSDMPESRAAGAASVVDGKIYLLGGYGGSDKVDEYDPITDTWTEKAEMPTKRIGLSSSVLDSKIYVIGGFIPGISGYPGITPVDVYDPVTDTWSIIPDMPTGRFGAYTAVVDGKIYVIGGLARWITDALEIVEVYEPQSK